MQKQIGILVALLFLAACAEIPAWWNPRGTAGTTQKAPVVSSEPSKNRVQTPSEPVELDLSLQDETYEEMTITPLQDEEEENDSGDASAQSVVPPEDELPAPSILEE